MLRRGRSVRPTNQNGIMAPPVAALGSVVTPHDFNAMIAMGTGGPMPSATNIAEPMSSSIISASAMSAVASRTPANMTLAQIASTVQQWQQILSEITQAVFVVVGEVLVPSLPLYVDLPTTKADLAAPVRSVSGTITVLYPQFTREEYIFMRVRVVDPNTAEVQQYYAPIAPANEKNLFMNGSYYPQYVGNFRNPGEPGPSPDTEDFVSA